MPTTEAQRKGLWYASSCDEVVPVLNNSLRPGLAVDTSFSRHSGKAPQQVYPQVALPDQIGTNGSDGSDGPVKGKKKRGFKLHLGTAARMRPGPQKSIEENNILKAKARQSAVGPVYETHSTSQNNSTVKVPKTYQPVLFKLQDAPKAKRFNTLQRPAPLNLGTQISPSDRSIPIGIALPSASILEHKYSLESAATHPQSSPERKSWLRQELNTPSIVITPAEDDFEHSLTSSPHRLKISEGYRPRSSVYSRYSNGVIKGHPQDNTPPVPPLPSFAAFNGFNVGRIGEDRLVQSAFDDTSPPYPLSGDSNNMTPDHEDDHVTPLPSARSIGRMSSQANLPTPRRSKGWWNVLLSPLTTSSTSRAFSFRSPSAIGEEAEDDAPILANAFGMDGSEYAMLTDQSPNDNGLRSAPPTESCGRNSRNGLVTRPKRSDTAPGALDLGSTNAVNIYRVPSYGAACSYYDRNRHFPSLMGPLDGDCINRGGEDGWSPSQSVYRQSRGHLPMPAGFGGDGLADTTIQRQGEAASYYNGEITPPGSGDGDVIGPPMINSRSPLDDVGYEPGHGYGFINLDDSAATPAPAPIQETAPATRSMQWPFPEEESGARQPTPEPPASTSSGHGLPSRPIGNYVATLPDDSTEELPPPGKMNTRFQEQYVTEKDLEYALEEEREPKRSCCQRYSWLVGGAGILIVITVAVLLIIFLPLYPRGLAVEARWLDLTGFPPLPTGVTTVVGPKQVKDVNGCVNPQALWSCSVPPGEKMSMTQAGEPNFRFLIRFRNSTLSNETLLEPSNSTINRRNFSPTARASTQVKRSLFDNAFLPLPAPPSKEDQIFLGRTTENNSQPFNGEWTPFYMSLLDPIPLRRERRSRIEKRNDGFHYPYPTPHKSDPSGSAHGDSASNLPSQGTSPGAAAHVPLPALVTHHKPAPAQVYPFASSQPLRLFNRGQDDEYYGFYTYFDRSIFIAESANSRMNESTRDLTSTNVPIEGASAICTWSQTRLLVQIWTGKSMVAALNSQTNVAAVPAVNSTANDMTAPGSFPYSVTITLDRHGGDANKKGVYCYDLDEDHRVIESSGVWIAENRKFGGTLINAAPVPGTHSTSLTRRDNGGSGIDGGTAGCSCSWEN